MYKEGKDQQREHVLNVIANRLWLDKITVTHLMIKNVVDAKLPASIFGPTLVLIDEPRLETFIVGISKNN